MRNFGRDTDGRLMCKGISGPVGHRAVLFSTSSMLSILLAATWVFLDGTFSVRPKFAETKQLHVIPALHLGSVAVSGMLCFDGVQNGNGLQTFV